MRIRRLTEPNERAAELLLDMWTDHARSHPRFVKQDHFTIEMATQYLSEATSELAYGAYEHGMIVGVVVGRVHERGSFWADSEYLYLDDVAVDPAHRRQGIATALLTTVLDEARKRGITQVEARTWEGTPGARELLAKLGLKEAYRTSGYEIPPSLTDPR